MPLVAHYALVYGSRKPPLGVVAALYFAFAGCAALAFRARGEWGDVIVGAYQVGAAAVAFAAAARTFLFGETRRRPHRVRRGGATAHPRQRYGARRRAPSRRPTWSTEELVAFVLCTGLARNARYANLVGELEKSKAKLELLATETGHVYEQLAATEEQLVQKEQLAVVGELAAVIAHEVRNPLAIITNAVAGLRKQVISREDRETLLSILDEEANRLNRLVTDLLRYARPVNVQKTHFSLSDLLDRALGHVKASDKGIAATLNSECQDERLWGDANLLRQVFDNLVDNAVQAMVPGGTLTIRVHTSTEDGVDGLAVDIIDTGEGMDTHVRSRARDPFFTTRPSGTGLGLAIVDRIVEAHAGHFSIDSHAGEGTTVTVFLPLGSPSEPPMPRRAKSTRKPPQAPPPS